jgi:hypothetical protein
VRAVLNDGRTLGNKRLGVPQRGFISLTGKGINDRGLFPELLGLH